MNIVSVQKTGCFVVEVEGDEWQQYTRYGPESWTVRMGESDEPVYNCEAIEAAFQAHLSAQDTDDETRGALLCALYEWINAGGSLDAVITAMDERYGTEKETNSDG